MYFTWVDGVVMLLMAALPFESDDAIATAGLHYLRVLPTDVTESHNSDLARPIMKHEGKALVVRSFLVPSRFLDGQNLTLNDASKHVFTDISDAPSFLRHGVS